MALREQVVLITGCSSGIGRALSRELAGRGHQVFASARSPASLSSLTADGIATLALDVTQEQSVAEAVSQVIARAGRIDMLINNAGFNLIGPLAEMPLDEVKRLFDTNLVGLLGVIQAVFPHLAERRAGRIVNIGSVVGLLPTPFAGPYCASKAAVHMLSEVLRMEVAPFGVDVIVVQPGGVRSRIAETASRGIERYASAASRYHAGYRGIQKRARASQNRPMETEAFARVVAEAILADQPPRLVRAGRGARIYPAMSRMPGRLRERVLSRAFELDTLK